MSKEEIEKEAEKQFPSLENSYHWAEQKLLQKGFIACGEFILQQLSQRKKTLQECKEEVAKRRGYRNWLEALTINWSGDHHIFWNEVCELYLQSNQLKSK